MMKLLLPIALFSLVPASAATFSPYDGAPSEFRIETGLGSRLTRFPHRNAKLSFFSPIASSLNHFLERTSATRETRFCGTLTGNSCSAWREACLGFEFPEARYRKQGLGGYDERQIDTLEGILRISVGPLRLLDAPAYLVPPKLYPKFQTALWRLRFPQLASEMKATKERLAGTSCEANGRLVLEALQEHITNQARQGFAENKEEAARLKAAGFCPAELGKSHFTRDDRALLSGLAGAMAWRMRGEGIWRKESTTELRKRFGKRAFKTLVLFNAPEATRLAEHVGDAQFERLALKGWNEWFDMGRVSGDEMSDLEGMTRRGFFQVGEGSYYGPIAGRSGTGALTRAGFDASGYKIGGLQMGACYYVAQYGLHTRDYNIGVHWPAPLVAFTHTAITWGELCAGAAMGMGLSYSLSAGPRCGARGDLPPPGLGRPAPL